MTRGGSTPVPVIETARLRLRGWHSEDVEAFAAIVADREAMRHLHLPAAETAAQTIARLQRRWSDPGFAHWAVEERASGRLIGRLGLMHHPDWTLDPSNVEVGWSLRRSVWGHGLATEGAEAALGYGFERLNRNRIISIADPANAASLRVMEKLGMSPGGRARWRGTDVVWYRLDRSEWLAPAARSDG